MDLKGLPPEASAAIEQMQQRLQRQDAELAQREQALAERDRTLAERDRELAEHQALLQRKDREIALREAKLVKLNFVLARLKRWKLGARTEAMNAQQRRLFEETLAEDEASVQAQLDRLRKEAAPADGPATKPKAPPRQPWSAAPQGHLRRVEHRHEPDDTTCPTPGADSR